MISTILQFIGLTPAPKPKRPPSARRVAPAPRKPVAPVAPAKTGADDVARIAARDARNAAILAERRALDDVRYTDAVRLILRAHDRSTELNFDPKHVRAAESLIGEATAEFMRACRYAGVRLPGIGDGMSHARLAAYRVELVSRTMTDLDAWERGEIALVKAQGEARRHGEPVPPALVMPAEVVAGIAKIAQQRIERLAKRAGGKAGTVTTTTTGTETQTTTDSSTVPSTTASDDETETYTPPGSKR